MKHFKPLVWELEGRWGLNQSLYAPAVDWKVAHTVGRLLAGGQGLRAGDPCHPVEVSAEICCMWCLERGIVAGETLEHFLRDCGAYSHLRLEHTISKVLSSKDFSVHHRAVWGWRELKALQSFCVDAWMLRSHGRSNRTVRREHSQRAKLLWP